MAVDLKSFIDQVAEELSDDLDGIWADQFRAEIMQKLVRVGMFYEKLSPPTQAQYIKLMERWAPTFREEKFMPIITTLLCEKLESILPADVWAKIGLRPSQPLPPTAS